MYVGRAMGCQNQLILVKVVYFSDDAFVMLILIKRKTRKSIKRGLIVFVQYETYPLQKAEALPIIVLLSFLHYEFLLPL
jgi:hypothetical protein